jgi:hypothetical protein
MMQADVYRDWRSRRYYVEEARVTSLMTDEQSLYFAIVQYEDDWDEYMGIVDGECIVSREVVERMGRRVKILESLLREVDGDAGR